MSGGGSVGWSTENEKFFISHLGEYSKFTGSREELLTRYIAAAKVRTRWGTMNREEIIAYAEEQLEGCNG